MLMPMMKTSKKMSKTVYRIHLIGICIRMMRSLMFNICVFCVGAAFGMGFMALHVQKIWKEKYSNDTIVKLERVLAEQKMLDGNIETLLAKIRD